MTTINFLEGIEKIPGFELRVTELRKKHNYPRNTKSLYFLYNSNLYVSKAFYADVLKLRDDVIQYIKVTFPNEINSDYLFKKSLYEIVKNNWHYRDIHVKKKCTDELCIKFYNHMTNKFDKSMEHIHYDSTNYYVNIESYVNYFSKPNCTERTVRKRYTRWGQEGLEQCIEYNACYCSKLYDYELRTIEVRGIDKALITAYNICLTGQPIIQQHKLKLKKDSDDYMLKLQVAKQERNKKLKDFEQQLRNSLSIHYFPERIENGVRKPAEWLPDFNINIVNLINNDMDCREYGNNMVSRIKTECKPIIDQMSKQFKLDKQKEYEDAQARIMATAMTLSDNTLDNVSIMSDPTDNC
jgi:hypothetical protein